MLNTVKKQQGFIKLKAVIIVFMLVLIAITLAFFYYQQEEKKDNSKVYGEKISQYTAAARSALVVDGENIFAAGAKKTGTDWLKINDGTCPGGVSQKPYLDCAFKPALYGAVINGIDITIESNGDVRRPIFSSVIRFPGIIDSDSKALTELTETTYQFIVENNTRDKALSFSNGVMEYQYFKVAGTYTNPSTGTVISIDPNTIVAFIASAAIDANKPTEQVISAANKQGASNAANFYAGASGIASNGSSLLNNTTMSNLTASGAGLAKSNSSDDSPLPAVKRVVAIGGDCAPDALVLKDASEQMLVCDMGKWKELKDRRVYTCPFFEYKEQAACETSFSTCTGEMSTNSTCWYLADKCEVKTLKCKIIPN